MQRLYLVFERQIMLNSVSLRHDKQSAAQFGIRVRDPSQMFMFGGTNWAQGFSNRLADADSHFQSSSSHESAGLLTKNRSQQAGIFGKSFTCNQSAGSVTSVNQKLSNKEDGNSLETEIFTPLFVKTGDFGPNSSGNMFKLPNKVDEEHSVSINEVPKSESDDAFTASYDNNNASHSPYFGLRLTTQSQRPLVNHLDPCRIYKPTGLFSKPSQCPKSQNNQLSDQNCMTSHLVSVKKEGGQRGSTGSANVWLDAPVQQNSSVTGSCELPSTSYAANNRIRNTSSTHLQQLDSANRNPGFFKSKKIKCSTFEGLPWREELTEGSSRLDDISTAELEWAHSAVQLPEELKELAEEISDSYLIINRKRRLSLTTELMQLLFKPPPAIVLAEDAITHCDIVAYHACKLALGDACCLCLPAEKNMTSKSSSDHDLLEVIEGFIDRSKRLEDDVSRLEKGKPLILEVMMDIQDLEKNSFINRLAKFHTRRPTVTRPKVTGDTSSSSSSSSMAMRKLNPTRYVKAMPMPKTVPEGQNCLFL